MVRRKVSAVLVVAALSALVSARIGHGATAPPPEATPDATCYSDPRTLGRAVATGEIDPLCGGGLPAELDGFDEGASGVFTGSSAGMYGYSGDYAAGRCRSRWARRTRKAFSLKVVYNYYQQVDWCWNGYAVTFLRRYRWPADVCCLWQFDRHVAGNCSHEFCVGKTGRWAENVWTQGQFHACTVYVVCNYKYPYVSITVYGNGHSEASHSG